ncbi:hypothetical protein SBOR_3007 [Sclerotinia borealis F-4128]|uniref:Uncharacterized protein n=1 Tax=Sclerotinia borealis (strain F-4128) TaxID=1432307 RepID=W9CQ64_SCLBF|nr:hypothetical protein SBOR_3007 [Sclerotinia borealis F-4128]
MVNNNTTTTLPLPSAVIEATTVKSNANTSSSPTSSALVATTAMNPTFIQAFPSKFSSPIYTAYFSTTLTSLRPAILYASHGTNDYSIIQAEYKRINLVISDAPPSKLSEPLLIARIEWTRFST